MTPQATLIGQTSVDFNTFLGAAYQILGYSPSEAIDKSPLKRSDPERFISCLAAIKHRQAPVGLTPAFLDHVSFSAMVVADERDLIDIVACCGMPFVTGETVSRGVLIAVVSGTLSQWRDAIKIGCRPESEADVRHVFNVLHQKFDALGLDVWRDCQPKSLSDRTYLLEDKR